MGEPSEPGGERANEPAPESDLRRRAAWLLAMLAVVAVLFVILLSQVLGTGGGSDKNSGPRALDSAVAAVPTGRSSGHSGTSTGPANSTSQPARRHSSTPAGHRRKCPTQQVCVIDGDPGDGIAAINDYRTQHGKDAVTGRVSPEAQQCAIHNGNGCSGGWAETELAKLDGPAAVQKILPFAHLLDSMKNFEVGWAYDPGAKLYYFAIIRNA